jgi:biotin operon repressor
MKIDTDDYLTVEQVAERLGTNRRGVYRAIKRAREAGHEVTVNILGRNLLTEKSAVVLKGFYFPYYSEAHQANVKKWGAKGGATKAANRRAASPPEQSS